MKRFCLLVCCLCMVLALSACRLSDNMPNAEENTHTAETEIPYTSVRREVYTDDAHPNSRISIAYPVFLQSGMEEINADIADFVSSFVTEEYGENISDLDLEINYEIKRYDAAYLSILFEGTGNVYTAAYPNNLFVTKNYDIQQTKEITLGDICTVDTVFAEKLYAAMQQKVEGDSYYGTETDSDAIMQMICPDTAVLLRELLTCDMDLDGCQSYLTPQAIGISLPVPHALGDHVEVEISMEKN